MDDIPVVPLAMVVIAFLSWLRNRLKKTSEIRRARNLAKAEVARARRTTQPAKEVYQSPYRDEPASEVVEEVPKSFRELFNEINAQKEIASIPPPLPTPKIEAKAEPDEEAWGDGDGFGAYTAVPKSASAAPKKRKRFNKKGKHTLAKTLSNGNQLRNALILREILDPPKALSNKSRRR